MEHDSSFGYDDRGFLTGKILVAMPHLSDPRFDHTVIYVCGHDSQGAMGLIVNKLLPSVSFLELISQMGIDTLEEGREVPVHYGGPVEVGRGFVLHSTDYLSDSTVIIENGYAMTATLDILRAIANEQGPSRAILALGYVGWGAGQLEQEIHQNGWLMIDADMDLIFSQELELKWREALASIGVDPSILSIDVGHA
jgi:putative transcriptional regulator